MNYFTTRSILVRRGPLGIGGLQHLKTPDCLWFGEFKQANKKKNTTLAKRRPYDNIGIQSSPARQGCQIPQNRVEIGNAMRLRAMQSRTPKQSCGNPKDPAVLKILRVVNLLRVVFVVRRGDLLSRRSLCGHDSPSWGLQTFFLSKKGPRRSKFGGRSKNIAA